MRESMGSAFVYSIVITIIGIILLLLVGSIGYSKAYKVNSRIIDIIEANGGFNAAAEEEIGEVLLDIGYRTVSNAERDCPENGARNYKKIYMPGAETKYTHDYCVYEHSNNRGTYYTVLTYMYFDFPVIGDRLKLRFTNQTKTLGLFGGD